MPLHNDMALLDSRIRDRAISCVNEMKKDSVIVSAGYTVVVLETLRELAVQMAYAVKARIKARPEDGKTDLEWVRTFFKKAGLSWAPSANENMIPSTWTLDSRHIDGLAFDAAPSRDGKNPDWNAPDVIWDRMATIAEKHRFAAGRRWKNKDSPHFEEP